MRYPPGSAIGQGVGVAGVSNDWERRYKASVACPVCGRSDVHASDCSMLQDKQRRFRRLGLPIVLIAVAVAIWQGEVGNLVAAGIACATGCAAAAAVIGRARRSP
jgi:hypothetical protein